MPSAGKSHSQKWPNGCQGVQRQREDSWGRMGSDCCWACVGPLPEQWKYANTRTWWCLCLSVNILKPEELHTGQLYGLAQMTGVDEQKGPSSTMQHVGRG